MGKYSINGAELTFDPMDLDNLERLNTEAEKARKTMEAAMKLESSIEGLRKGCNAFFEFFDNVLGPGTAQKLFHGKTNAREIITAYHDFTAQAQAEIGGFTAELLQDATPKPVNRAQRRAAKK